ncbi:hypothetical protein NDN01_06365 [Sphingomonas sp. QA11]|uniref:hypothetical protein n=1 Tax=Sphingomonas sp. QA11 TaxID=2950605 RepID=UPI0023496B25|nr:hypothetical protein [Sphingomonas sp. QA11]WCM28541.1 hypothetical protein NDN01_06365 [Sphingomonas sp. QA11]
MAGVIGATSGKFILVGAALLLHGRVDEKTVSVSIAPGIATSAMTPELAEHVKMRGGGPDVAIHLRAESFRARVAAVETEPGPDAALRIGQDLLDENPIEIDFAHHVLQPLSASEARRLERRSQPIVIRHEPDGTLSVNIAADGGAPLSARLDLSSVGGVTAPGFGPANAVKVGGVEVPKTEVTDGPRPTVGLYAFRHARVIFDLGHDRIWVTRSG